MVYCHNCGTKNDEGVEFCSNCGSSLKVSADYKGDRGDSMDDRLRQRNECFGLPHGGLIVGLLFGSLLILFGISSIYGFDIWMYIWPIVIIIVGILIIAGAIYSYTHR
jgi:hypothetical protein